METSIQNFMDVREIEPRNRHAKIFERFDSMNLGGDFVLINDHDPKPLYYQILAERGNIFDWQYLESGPEVWHVLIKKRDKSNSETVGEIAAKDIRKAQVFKNYGIDFCCGGKKSIEQACEEKGVDIRAVEKELAAINMEKPALNFDSFSLDFLCDYIMNTHHLYVKETLPLILELSTKVLTKHGEKYLELKKIDFLVQSVYQEMMLHMQKEEKVLFPFIKKIVQQELPKMDSFSLREPITMMEMEHELVGELFKEIAIFSNGYTAPENACNSFKLLYKSLQEFYDDLITHIHLENNILFPKSLNLVYNL